MKFFAPLLFIVLLLVGVEFARDMPAALRPMLIEQRSESGSAANNTVEPPASPARTERYPPENRSRSQFDVAMVQPNGTSVFAGRSAPNSNVVILADDEPIGFTVSDENGEWVFTTNRNFVNPDPKLSVETGARTSLVSTSVPQSAEKLASASPGSATILEELKQHLETTSAKHGNLSTKVAVATSLDTGLMLQGREVLPVPIQFVFREADFTNEGRDAAQLLLQYLLTSDPVSVKMTGHADERGGHDFNMELSARRLEAVATFLRDGGFKGEMELTPKGDTEPFSAVDRENTPTEVLYDLDRRVELILKE